MSRHLLLTTALSLSLALTMALPGAFAPASAQDYTQALVEEQMARFTNRAEAPAAADAIVDIGQDALPYLFEEAFDGDDLVRRGWAGFAHACFS